MESPAASPEPALCHTGIAGLDDILGGGLPRERFYLVLGDSGVGKTTLSLQFLLNGRDAGEPTLYVTLSETKDEIFAVARSHGWDLSNVHIIELSAIEDQISDGGRSTLFHPSEVELNETTRLILDEVERIRPQRLVLDSLSELRLLAGEPLRYRRQLLALKQFFIGRQCTVLMLDDRVDVSRDLEAQNIVHGVLVLQNLAPEYGGERRRLRVLKLRGVAFRGGYHDYVLQRGGLAVFPRLVAAKQGAAPLSGQLASGVPGLDALLGGGLDLGTSNLIIGPAGTGKTVIATAFAVAAAARGERVEIFTFDETRGVFLARARLLGQDLLKHLDSGLLGLHQLDPAELSPGEFAHRVREGVRQGVKLVVIDSVNGYLAAMPDERHLGLHLHELCAFCSQSGAVLLMLAEQTGVIGVVQNQVDVTYLADTVVMMRHFEASGEIRQAISMVKKRSGFHERSIREMRIDSQGLRVGEPLHSFRGVLTGTPVYEGRGDQMMPSRDVPTV